MKEAAWKYSHGKQLLLDGTFGMCNCQLLLFTGLTIDDQWRGVPIVFFLFSAPTSNQETHMQDMIQTFLRSYSRLGFLASGKDQ